MTDTQNVGDSASPRRPVGILRDNVDVLLVLATFTILAYVTTSYEEGGLFPFVFLVGGAVFLVVELLSHFLPAGYRQSVRDVLTRELGEVDLSDDVDQEDTEETEKSVADVGAISLLLGVFFGVTILVNFLTATVIFTLLTGYYFGLRDYRVVVLTAVLAITIYVVFGQIINTPILA